MGRSKTLYSNRIERVHRAFDDAAHRFDSFHHFSLKQPPGYWRFLANSYYPGEIEGELPSTGRAYQSSYDVAAEAVDDFWLETLSATTNSEFASTHEIVRGSTPFTAFGATCWGRWITALDDNDFSAARHEYYRLANLLLLEDWGFDLKATRDRFWLNCDADSWLPIVYREVPPLDVTVNLNERSYFLSSEAFRSRAAAIRQAEGVREDAQIPPIDTFAHPANFFVASARAIEAFVEIEWIGPKSPNEWAKVFGTSWKTIRRRIQEGAIRARGDSSRCYWIAESDLPTT